MRRNVYSATLGLLLFSYEMFIRVISSAAKIACVENVHKLLSAYYASRVAFSGPSVLPLPPVSGCDDVDNLIQPHFITDKLRNPAECQVIEENAKRKLSIVHRQLQNPLENATSNMVFLCVSCVIYSRFQQNTSDG